MPHSPYTTTVHPPISDLESYERDLNIWRAKYDDEDHEDVHDIAEGALEIAEHALRQCRFLDRKLDIKKRANAELEKLLQTNEAKLAKVQEQLDRSQDDLQSKEVELQKLREQLDQARDEVRSLKDTSQILTLETESQPADTEMKSESTTVVGSAQNDQCDTSRPLTSTTGTSPNNTLESVIPRKRVRRDS